MYKLLNVFRSIIWIGLALPLALVSGILGGAAVFLETMLRRGDDSWHPLHPNSSVRHGKLPDGLQPPVQVDE